MDTIDGLGVSIFWDGDGTDHTGTAGDNSLGFSRQDNESFVEIPNNPTLDLRGDRLTLSLLAGNSTDGTAKHRNPPKEWAGGRLFAIHESFQ